LPTTLCALFAARKTPTEFMLCVVALRLVISLLDLTETTRGNSLIESARLTQPTFSRFSFRRLNIYTTEKSKLVSFPTATNTASYTFAEAARASITCRSTKTFRVLKKYLPCHCVLLFNRTNKNTLLPAYHFNRLNPKDPSRFTVSFTANGSPDEQIYNITHSTETGNTYSVTYSDAHFPTIAYASVACSLEFPLASPSADANAPKVLLPSEFTVNLFNPDFQVTVEMKHSTLKGNFWEFSMPKHSFPPPTNSQIDAGYTPPVSERLYFRWRKEGGVLSRSQLRCSLVSTANTPGSSSRDRKAGAKEPDITLAMYEGVGDKHGRGEFVVYESNFRRVDIEDLKGLDLVMVIGARVINDIWFCPTATTFNTGSEVMVGSGSKQKGKNSPPVPVLASQPVPLQAGPPPQPGTFSQRFRQHQRQGHEQSPPAYPAGSGGLTAYPPEKTNGPTPEQERAKKDQERRRIEAEQAEIHCMLAREEAQEQARKQAAINAETERLKRLYQQESRNRPQRPGPPAPVSQNTRPVQQMPTQSRYRFVSLGSSYPDPN
jgi:hypothetical protein